MIPDTTLAKLKHHRWQVRNVAIKELASIHSKEACSLLLATLEDSTPAAWWMRCMGEPFYQVGFIRRNTWKGLEQQSIDEKTLTSLLCRSAQDPYYEVRLQALKTLNHKLTTRKLKPNPKLCELVEKSIQRKQPYEITIQCIYLLPYLFGTPKVLQLGAPFRTRRQWRIRAAVLEVCISMLQNGQISSQKIANWLKDFPIMSEYFSPVFVLQDKKAQLDRLLQGKL